MKSHDINAIASQIPAFIKYELNPAVSSLQQPPIPPDGDSNHQFMYDSLCAQAFFYTRDYFEKKNRVFRDLSRFLRYHAPDGNPQPVCSTEADAAISREEVLILTDALYVCTRRVISEALHTIFEREGVWKKWPNPKPSCGAFLTCDRYPELDTEFSYFRNGCLRNNRYAENDFLCSPTIGKHQKKKSAAKSPICHYHFYDPDFREISGKQMTAEQLNSPEYQAAMQRNLELEEANERFDLEWQTAWFETVVTSAKARRKAAQEALERSLSLNRQALGCIDYESATQLVRKYRAGKRKESARFLIAVLLTLGILIPYTMISLRYTGFKEITGLFGGLLSLGSKFSAVPLRILLKGIGMITWLLCMIFSCICFLSCKVKPLIIVIDALALILLIIFAFRNMRAGKKVHTAEQVQAFLMAEPDYFRSFEAEWFRAYLDNLT